jgi:small subunit ribosomal protein S20
MANHKSSLKSIRQTERKTKINQARRTRMRTYIRKVEEAITSGQKEHAQKAFREMEPLLMKEVRNNLLHINTAARKLSRTSARIKALAS